MRNKWCVVVTGLLFLFAACNGHTSQNQRATVDSLNSRAYGFRYVDIDSVKYYANEAYRQGRDYTDGRNEALLNLAFCAYQQMDFDGVDSLLNQLHADCNSKLLLLCADVMQMKSCQRTGQGSFFFQAKSRAERYIEQITKHESRLSPHDVALWVYAQTEFHIIASTYYFYQEQDAQARAELDAVLPCLKLHVDTVQWVYYNYMLGPGGLVEGRDAQDITLQEFDYLFRAYISSRRDSLRYFEANSLQAFSTMFLANDSLIRSERSDAYNLLRFQHDEWGGEEVGLPLSFARHALHLFQTYNDLFQTACTYRTLGEIYFQQQAYEQAIDSYRKALHCVNLHHLRYYGNISPDTLCAFNPNDLECSIEKAWIDDPRVSTVPEWIAGIRQQLSLVYSALDMKQASDYNRNSYLDLLLASNQDLELENRTAELKLQTKALYTRMYLCLLLVVFAVLMGWIFRRRMQRRLLGAMREVTEGKWQPYNELQEWSNTQLESLQDAREELEEQLQISYRGVEENKRKNAENRAKVSLVHSIVPFLDRIGGEVVRIKREGHISAERSEYIIELVDEIERHNAVLTEWIKMEQGQLRLNITTFPLDRLFRIVAEGHYSFDQKQVTLHVEPVNALVKADESLTLFMINTLADNARKFTPSGGRVTISADETDEYVEVQVSDTGCGLSPEDVETLTNNKVYDAVKIGSAKDGKGFGFGLMNCRGIIEKYKKTSELFSCCAFGVRSKLGEGSTFYFRLPRVVRLVLALLVWPFLCQAMEVDEAYDSLYKANLNGCYELSIHYADKVITALNRKHSDLVPIMLIDHDPNHHEAAELQWAREGVVADYELIVGLRNEVALAALAVHDFALYQYNNRACIRLHKFIHQDTSLPTHFHRLEQTHRNSNLLLMLIFVISVVILYMSYKWLVRSQMVQRRDVESLKYNLSAMFAEARKMPSCQEFLDATSSFPKMKHWAEQYRQQIADEVVTPMNQLREDIARYSDEQARFEFERNRLHVQNQILDNCLSTIKHESMYYPSRIRVLTEKMQDDDIDQLAELVNYYRHIYTLLCQQADEQVRQPGFKRQRVSVETLLDASLSIARRFSKRKAMVHEPLLAGSPSVDAYVMGDSILLNLLFESLLSEMLSHDEAQLTISAEEEGSFVRFTLCDQATTLSQDTLDNIFFPDASHIPCLLAKQILREHDTYANHPGCRLVAQQVLEGKGYEIYFTLLKM